MLKKLLSLFKNSETNPDNDIMYRFKVKYENFKMLLEANSELLKIISDIEEKLSGHHLFGISYLQGQTARVIFYAAKMVKSFEKMSGRTYPVLTQTVEDIYLAIRLETEKKSIPRITEYIIPYFLVNKEKVDFVGGKNANLGEVRNRVGLPIPRGFAVTTAAFDEFLRVNRLEDKIKDKKTEIDMADPESIIRVSDFIHNLFITSPLPGDVEKAILDAYEELIAGKGPDGSPVKIAIRSSALGEDSELSFAGQYLTVLNVPSERIISEYKEVLASLFSPRALSYRLSMGIPFEQAAMSVACLEMVPSKVSGVMYSTHPFHSSQNTILITAVWGLGPYAVDGVVSPDTYILSKDTEPVLLESKISEKPVLLAAKSDGYLEEVQVHSEHRNHPCLTAEQAVMLANFALRLENHFQCPQDIEWAMDQDNRLVILQTRPLRTEKNGKKQTDSPRVEGYPLILEGGSIACPGVGFGPAHFVRSENDLVSFPDSGVLVAAHSSPQYVMVMPKASAILTDSGSVTGHMASLAREFKVPSILDTRSATALIRHGENITVDAYSGRVYRGKVEELIEVKRKDQTFMADTPIYKVLRTVADYIIPLNLRDPKSPEFAPQNCKTIHDIMRLVHERSYSELFQISDMATGHGSISVKLNAPLPIDLYIVDLGGGLEYVSKKSSSVTQDQVVSAPFKAVLRGMLRSDLKRSEPRPVELRGFFSVMSQQMLSPPNLNTDRFGDKSYAIISDKYLNFSSRVGYHYSILDAYCGLTATKNHINFQFKGGAADDVRRNRRVRLIENILRAMGFLTEVQGDRVTSRFTKGETAIIEDKLDHIGRLLFYTRQMDMLMHSEESVNHLAECFLKGDYHLDRGNQCRQD